MYMKALSKIKGTGQLLFIKQGLFCTKDKRHSHQQVNELLGTGNGFPLCMERTALSTHICFQGSY